MILTAIRIELTKILKRSMTWVLIGIMALLVTVLHIALYATLQMPQSAAAMPPEAAEQLRASLCWPEAFPNLLGFAAGNALGGLMLVILTGAVVAQEYTWRTAHLWLGHGLPRPAFLLGKFAALAVAGLLFTLTPLAVGMPLTGWFTHHLTGSFGLAGLNVGHLALSILRTAYTLLPYLTLTLLLAILTRSVAAAVGIGLAYALLVEGILAQLLALAGGVWAELTRYLPGGLAGALMRLNQATAEISVGLNTGESGSVEPLGPWVAALGVALYTAAFLGLALWAFRRQDLTA